MTSLQVGSVIRSYKLVKHIGEGSSGFVYSAKDNSNRFVVLKFISLKKAWAKKEYDREISSLSKCTDCPLIVKLLHYFNYKHYGVIVLEQLSCDLLHYLQTFQKLGVKFVKTTFFNICVAVLFLHKRCIAHLDIKPENIFLTSTNQVKLGDFGSSYQWKDDFEFKLGAVGTSYYCAPEVGPSLPYNPKKADAWSLGILLHVLLTGFWPYKAKNEQMLHENVSRGDIHLFLDNLPDDRNLIELLENLLNVDPLNRYSIADVLSCDWLADINLYESNKSRTESAPDIMNIRLEQKNAVDFDSDNEFNDDSNDEQNDFNSGSNAVFTFSDEEQDNVDIGTWDVDNYDPNPFSLRSRKREVQSIANSLPKSLTREPIKKPRTLENPNSPNNTYAAPIKNAKKKSTKRRKSSLLRFFNSKIGPSRRLSSADAAKHNLSIE